MALLRDCWLVVITDDQLQYDRSTESFFQVCTPEAEFMPRDPRVSGVYVPSRIDDACRWRCTPDQAVAIAGSSIWGLVHVIGRLGNQAGIAGLETNGSVHGTTACSYGGRTRSIYRQACQTRPRPCIRMGARAMAMATF
ncbi:hypothetical protein PVAP13_6KG019156 [Panicum virgatum]|uniref:Uncharacterized protein n=1 Tax=Panicum virgatum TaxID=38727 RepID=A0A8T0R7W6_PANVG|nr:hypothetical protein PVAP13_6KG019156 [Panicum virgatum]